LSPAAASILRGLAVATELSGPNDAKKVKLATHTREVNNNSDHNNLMARNLLNNNKQPEKMINNALT
jgi:hypothetical protein